LCWLDSFTLFTVSVFFCWWYRQYIYNLFIAQGMMTPTTLDATSQIMRSNSFTLTGNTQATQIVSMTGTSCMTDWLSIPCATNLGRLPLTPLMCVDRLCGGTFNSETQNLNESSVISEYFYRNALILVGIKNLV